MIPFFVVKEFKGKDLVGIKYEQLIDYAKPYQNPENAFRVISGDFGGLKLPLLFGEKMGPSLLWLTQPQ